MESELNNSEHNNSEHKKIMLEHQAAKLFMCCYEHETGNPIQHLWHNSPAKLESRQTGCDLPF
ncbi:MAG: hypothetical protein QMC38_15210 [Sinobacterium sp.]